MAESILAILGVAIAVPGVAVSLAQCGDYIKDLANRFLNAPAAIREIGAFGRDLHQGKLKMDIEIFEAIWSSPDVDEVVKATIEDIIGQLRTSLIAAASTLDSFVDKRGNVRRTHFALFGERRSNRVLEQLKNWQSEFGDLIDLIDKKRRLVPDQLLLSRENFRVLHKADQQDYRQVEGTNIFVVDCEHKHGGRIRDIQCLVERRTVPVDVASAEIKTVATILASKLSTNTSSTGILQCLGYQDSAYCDLVFRLPPNTTMIQSLEVLIRSQGLNSQQSSSLEERLKLCRELCEGVLRVHTSNLVHKNIRASSVLLIEHGGVASKLDKSTPNAQQLGTAFLVDWYMLRQMTDLSSRRGTTDWTQDIYRHPRRQGRQPEERYHLGHDIYSLGVVLIEIVLWEAFIQPHQTPPVSALFKKIALGLNLVSHSESSNLDKLTAPLTVKAVLIYLSRTEVAYLSSPKVSEFVVACLTCLEGGMLGLPEQAFRDASIGTVLQIRELFLQTFPQS